MNRIYLMAIMAIALFGIAVPQSADALVEKETHVYAVKGGDTLRMDVYLDREVAYEGRRPVIVFSFGGGWEAGAREDGAGWHTPFVNTMARYGYVGVSIDYRLGYLLARKSGRVVDESIANPLVGGHVDRPIFEAVRDAVAMAVEDVYDATSYIVANSERWNADTQKVVLAGISAGGVNSLTAEYLCACGDSVATNHLPEGFRYAGVVAGCGAIWHDYNRPVVWPDAPCPVMFVHGDKDTIVPYERIDNEEANFTIEGSKALSAQFAESGWPYVLVTGRGGDHPYGGEAFAHDHDLIDRFISQYVTGDAKKSVEMVETPIVNKK